MKHLLALACSAPIDMPCAIKADLETLGVPVKMLEFDEGAHGVGNLIPQRVAHGYPLRQIPRAGRKAVILCEGLRGCEKAMLIRLLDTVRPEWGFP